MRIAVIGAGGVGGYFGARLALGGADVSLLARGEHLEAMRSHGLMITAPKRGGDRKGLVKKVQRVADGTRTRDTQDHNLVLYQLNYSHHRRLP